MKHVKIEDWKFDELAEYVREQMFDALMTGGTREMKSRFYAIYEVVIRWQAAANTNELVQQSSSATQRCDKPLTVMSIVTAFVNNDSCAADAYDNLDTAVEILRQFGAVKILWQQCMTGKAEEVVEQYE